MKRREFVQTTAAALAGSNLAGRLSLAQGSPTFVPTRFGRIACIDRGRGSAALFLHGFPLSGYQWRGAIERLASRRRCIAPDFLALGRTEVAEGQGVAPDDQVNMLVELLDTLKVPSVDLVANDSGGAVAQLFLVRHPKRTRSLLLTNCDTEPDSPPKGLQPVLDSAHKGKFVEEWIAPGLADKNLARSDKGIGGACYSNPAHPTDDAIEEYWRPMVASPRRKVLADAYALSLEKNPLEGIEKALKRSTVPTRILWGTADTIFSADSPAYLDRTFGRSLGVRLLPGMKLFWPEELSEVIAEEAATLWK